jgi:hypothetical protein
VVLVKCLSRWCISGLDSSLLGYLCKLLKVIIPLKGSVASAIYVHLNSAKWFHLLFKKSKKTGRRNQGGLEAAENQRDGAVRGVGGQEFV